MKYEIKAMFLCNRRQAGEHQLREERHAPRAHPPRLQADGVQPDAGEQQRVDHRDLFV